MGEQCRVMHEISDVALLCALPRDHEGQHYDVLGQERSGWEGGGHNVTTVLWERRPNEVRYDPPS